MGAVGVTARPVRQSPARAAPWRVCTYSVAAAYRRLDKEPIAIFVALNERAKTIEARARIPLSACELVGNFFRGISFDDLWHEIEHVAGELAQREAIRLRPDDQREQWRAWAIGDAPSPPPVADQRAARAA